MKKPLSKTLRIFYGVGDLGFSLAVSVQMYLQTYFLTDVARFNLAMVALIITIPATFDAIFSPVYGAIIDAVKPMKWGKFRSWLLVCPPIAMLLLAFEYTKIGPDIVAALIIIATTILSKPVVNTAWVVNAALIPQLANNPQEKILLTSRRAVWTNVATLFFSYIGAPLALFFGNLTSPIMGYTILEALMGVCMVGGFYAIFKMTNGYDELPDKNVVVDLSKTVAKKDEDHSKAAAKKKDRVSGKDILRNLFQNPPLIFLIISDYSRYIATFVINATIAYYFAYVAQNMALMPLFMFLIALAAIIGSFATPALNKLMGTRMNTIITTFLAGVFLIVAKFFGQQTSIFIVLFTIAEFFLGVNSSTFVALYSDTTVYGEWKTGKNTSGFIMGLMNLPVKFGTLTRGAILAFAFAAIGFVAKMAPTPGLKEGLVNIFVLIPAIGLILTAFILVIGFRLSDAKLKQMTEEINTRKQEAIAG